MRAFFLLATFFALFVATHSLPAHARDTASGSGKISDKYSPPPSKSTLAIIDRLKGRPPSGKQISQAKVIRGTVRSLGPTSSVDEAWADLIAPINYCVDFVRSRCGVNRQCYDSSACQFGLQMLALYYEETDPQDANDFEHANCVVSLGDPVLAICEP